MTTAASALHSGFNGRFGLGRSKYASEVMRWEKRIMSPNEARWILDELNISNRSKIPSLINRLIHAINTGKWICTGQGIIFLKSGTLADGQNRLEAIAQSGVAVEICITYGVDPDAFYAMDQGKTRTATDIGVTTGRDIRSEDTAVASKMMFYIRSKSRGNVYSVLEMFDKHKEAIRFAVSLGNAKYQRLSPVRAVLARAWYTEDRDRIACFSRVLGSGLIEHAKSDDAAIKFRDWISGHKSGAGTEFQVDCYCRCQAALRAFLNGKRMKVNEIREIIFPIPGDPE